MDMPVYKFWRMKYTGAWYRLSPEEQQKLLAQGEEALKQVGGKLIVMAVTVWADEKWNGFGVEQYPNMDAVMQHTQLLWKLNWFHYIESESTLGVEMTPEMWG